MAKNKNSAGNKLSKNGVIAYYPTLNSEFTCDVFKKIFLSAYKTKSSFEKEGTITLFTDPFLCCEMYNFINESEFLHELRDELRSVQYFTKNNDLYKFKQSDDFTKLKYPYIQAIRKFLLEDFHSWISECTGIDLLKMVDLTASEYSYTDILLCHDDELESRKIAFALYFVDPPWSIEDGGMLELFSCDNNYEPTEVVKSIYPVWNKLVWFEVSEYSHHQVSEILSKDKSRLSVHGWFHSKPVPRPILYNEPDLNTMGFVEVEESILRSWINPIYLERVTQASIRFTFEQKSEIKLPDFIREEKLIALTKAFKDEKLKWEPKGPPNKRCFQALDIRIEALSNEGNPSSEDLIKEFVRVMASEAMFLILSNMTGLRLHKLIPKSSNDYQDIDGNDEDYEYDDEETDELEKGSYIHKDDGLSLANGADNNRSVDYNDIMNIKKKEVTEKDPPQKKIKLEACTSNIDSTEPCSAKCCFELRKWSHGSYSTANHRILSQPALDALIVFNINEEWKNAYGGFTSYIAKDEDEELLTIEPKANSLNLVYKEQEVLSFVKHINHNVKSILDESNQTFYDLSLSYFE